MRRTPGFTLVEMLVVLALIGVVLSVVFATVQTTTALYTTDTARVGANRTARAVFDSLGSDLQQAGERLPGDVPAVLVKRDANGQSVLTLRRALVDGALPLCAPTPDAGTLYVTADNPYAGTIGNGSNAVSNLPAACPTTPFPEAAWNTAISALPDTDRLVLIINVKTGVVAGARPLGLSTQSGTARQRVRVSALSTTRLDPRRMNKTDADSDIRLYLEEERTYAVNSGVLTLAENANPAQPAAPDVTRFEVTPYLSPTTPGGAPTATSLPFPGAGQSWKDLAYLDVALTVRERSGTRTSTRTYTERLTPRNAVSADQ